MDKPTSCVYLARNNRVVRDARRIPRVADDATSRDDARSRERADDRANERKARHHAPRRTWSC
eukprot:22537-Pelagococcus_subviridis.AAC.1